MAEDLKIRISIDADTKGINIVKDGLEKLPIDSTAQSVDKLSQRIGNMGHAGLAIVGLTNLFGTLTDSMKSVLDAGVKFDSINRSLNAIYGDSKKASDAMGYIRQTSDTLGLSMVSTAEAFKMFAASAMNTSIEGQKTKDIFTAVSEAVAVMGLSTEEHQGAMRALSQMMSKGKIYAEELTGQLGERLPGALKISADAMGVTTAELYKMMQDGKLLSEDFLPKFAAQLHKVYGDDAVNAAESARAKMEQFNNAVTDLKISIANSGVLDLAKWSAESGVEALKSADKIAMMGAAVVSVWTAQKAYTYWMGLSTAATIAQEAALLAAARGGGIFSASTVTASTTTGVFTAAMGRLNAVMMANPIIAGATIVAAGIWAVNEALKALFDTEKKRDANERASQEYRDKTAKYNASYAKLLVDDGEKLAQLEAKKSSYTTGMLNAKKSENDAAFKSYKLAADNVQKEIDKINNNVNKNINSAIAKHNAKSGGPVTPPHTQTEQELKAIERAQKLKEQARAKDAKEAEEAFKNELKFIDDREKATLSYYESIGDESTVFYIKEADKIQELAKAGILSNSQMLEVWLKDTAEFEQKKQQLIFQADEEAKAALKTYNDGLITAQIDYYTAIGDESSAYYLQEEEKMKKLAETGWYTNEQMNAIKAKDNQRFRDEQWKKDNAFWVDLFENINKAMDDQFFNAMNGKFTKFGDWLKDLWGSITQSMSRGLSKSLADMMTGAFYKENKDGSLSGLIPSLSTNTFRMAGSGAALGYGSVLSADQVAQLGGTFGQATVTAGGTILDQGGRVIEAGSDLSTIANGASIASGINSLYTLASEGLISIGGSIAGSLANGAGSLYGMGLTAGGDFLTGAGSMFAGNGVMGTSMAAQLGGLTVAGLGGALGGYATGKLGDKLFGADTKAGSYGAIGGSIGAIAGSIVPGLGTLVGGAIGTAIGSLIGGAFGSTKTKDAGLNFGKTTGAGLGFDSIQSYADMQKKSWFSNKKWTDFADISENDRKKIKGIFDSYDYLLAQLGSVKHVALSAGKYTKDTFQDELAKSFITSYTGMKEKFKASFGGFLILPEVENKAFTQIYNAWTEYAKSINKTTLEAITESVGQFVQSKRGFETWSLERSGNQIASLGKQAEWAQQDFDNLAKTIGVSGITVDNFLSKYEDAVKNSFDPNTIKQWDSLGSSLMNATNASDKYNQALADMASASNEASSTIANAASQLQAASAALNINLKSQQLTAYIAQMLAPDQKASALIGAESSRSQYDTLQKFYGTSLSDSEFLSTMQNSLSANQTEANVAMWNELSTAFAGAYQAEKQYQSIIESERIAQLQAEQQAAEALANQQRQAAEALANQQRQAAEEAARAAEERQRQLEEERKALEALKITSRDFLRGFNETILKDDPINLASYQLQYLTSDLNTFEQQLGISGVSLSNFATAYENAIAKNFTEENVNSWKSFGETLIKANDAQKAYNDSLKQTVNTGFMKDMMLSRVNQSGTALDIKEMVNQQAANNTNQSQQIAILYEVVKTLKDQLKIMKFGTTNQGVPA